MLKKILFSGFIICVLSSGAQDSLFVQLAEENLTYMTYKNGAFEGHGWNMVQEQSKASKHVLIGEDHFTREIPQLISAIGLDGQFDNFYIEVDPYTTQLLEMSLKTSELERAEFKKRYGKILSFYSLKDEYDLLVKMVKAGMELLGSDQIVMYDDRLLFDDLAGKTESPDAKIIYEYVSSQSKEHFERFLKDPQNNRMYMLMPDFNAQLAKLKELSLSSLESEIIKKLEVSADIYKTQSHAKRVQLLKYHLMNDFDNWRRKRNLFKYGANHMARGESFLTVTDIGNMVANIAEADYETSFHLMVMGESGMQASAFETFPSSAINPDGFYLKHLKPFMKLTEGDSWAVFNLIPLRRALSKRELLIENKNLERTIMGFDMLVLIPKVSPARF